MPFKQVMWRWMLLLLSMPVSAFLGMVSLAGGMSLSAGCIRNGLLTCFEDAIALNAYGLWAIGGPLGVIMLSPLLYWLLLVRQPRLWKPVVASEKEKKYMELP